MKILLTNDDGYNSKGIILLKQKLTKYGSVIVCAPEGSMSAKSTSITLGTPIFVRKVNQDTFAILGTPADCVAFGLTELNVKFDLVVSGCNHGLNISFDTMYSGTIGACQEALSMGVKSIAFSAEDNFDLVEKYFDEVMQFVISNDLLSIEYLVNVNFPKGDKVESIELGELYYRNDQNYFVECDQENSYMQYRHMQTNFDDAPNSDCYQVEHNIISIVPLYKSYFSKEIYKELVKKVNK